jgi:hypothetical protein
MEQTLIMEAPTLEVVMEVPMLVELEQSMELAQELEQGMEQLAMAPPVVVVEQE